MAESFAHYSCAIGLCCELITGVNRKIDLCPNWSVCSELTAGFKVQFRAPKCQLPYSLRVDGALVVGWLEPDYPEVCSQALSGGWAAAVLLPRNIAETPLFSILAKNRRSP
jgi:hypothetical protein